MTEEKKSSKEEEKKSDTAETKTDKEVEVPEKFKGVIEEIEKMSVLDLAELVTILEDKFNVSAAAPVAMAVAPIDAVDGEGSEAEEKSEYDVEITSAGESKIAVIKVVKEITEKGLKEAKDLVDAAPKVIKEKVAKEEAEELKKKLEEAGATIELK